MILYSSRSAKSVACRRLNVIGVRAFFFLPVLVAALTRADEFHSVTNTRCPAAISHFASSPNCVVFPDPSMPSTTNSFPGYSCGLVRLFNIRGPAHFNAKRFPQHPLERLGVPARRPQLELRIARRPNLQQPIVATIVKVERGDGLRVTAIEALGQTENRRQRPDRAPALARQLVEARMPPFGSRTSMIPRQERDCLDLVGLEAAQIAVLDQIVRVLVMPFVADMDADVVQDAGVLEPFALAIGEAVNSARLLEEGDGEPRHLVGMLRPEIAALGELDDAAAADVGVTIRLRDLLAVPRDVIEDQSFAQRQIAERQLGCAETAHDRVEQDRAGHRQIRAARLEARNVQPFLEIDVDDLLAGAAQLLGRDAAAAQRVRGAPVLGRRDGAEAEDRARRADHAIEAGHCDLVEIVAKL